MQPALIESTSTEEMTMDKKQQIVEALRSWINQRPGLDPRDYGDGPGYRSESRRITRQRDDALTLLHSVELADGLTAEALQEAFRAYSGRLVCVAKPAHSASQRAAYETQRARGGILERPAPDSWLVELSYCVGQYWPTEYRAAACAVLASALWDYKRDHCMPAPDSWRVESYGKWNGDQFERERSGPLSLDDARALLSVRGGQSYGHVQEYHKGKTPGDYLRATFAREFGRSIANRWFQ
jgi:hypothetical protein